MLRHAPIGPSAVGATWATPLWCRCRSPCLRDLGGVPFVLWQYFLRELVAAAARARESFPVLVPDVLRHLPRAALNFLGGDDAAIPDDVLCRLSPCTRVARDSVWGCGSYGYGAGPGCSFRGRFAGARWPPTASNGSCAAVNSVPVTSTITCVPMIATAPAANPRPTSARTDQRALGLFRRRQVRAIRPGCPGVPFVLAGTVTPSKCRNDD